MISIGRAGLSLLPPETAHAAGLAALARGLGTGAAPVHDPRLARSLLGLSFATPIGLAAGFDKDARATPAYAALGFGFAEIGTVTPRPQAGNPRPRLFRLRAERGVINRMGFNNGGVQACLERLAAQRDGGAIRVPLGINVGINKEGADPERDYPALVRAVAPFADYVTINVSSPNTPGLRDLQDEHRLGAILDAVIAAARPMPRLFVKLAPDLADDAVAPLVAMLASRRIAGVIAANTTVARPAGLSGAAAGQAGGLSGRPLRPRAKAMLGLVLAARDRAEAATGHRLAVIACGGIEDGRDAFERLQAGADLLQIYTSFSYEGPEGLARIERELLASMAARAHPAAAA